MGEYPLMGGAGGAPMVIEMGIVWLLTTAALILGVAALVKYLRSDSGRTG